MLIKDQAICIRAIDFSETSQIGTFFARATGKISAIAKGSKRPKSPFDGPIEVFSFGDIVFSDSHRDRLATLTEFRQAPTLSHIPTDLFTLNCCLFAAEILDRLTKDFDPHPDLFDQFIQFLRNVDEPQESNRRVQQTLIWLILFQLALLKEVGLRPILNACVNCKRPFSPAWREGYFSSSANGLVCKDCEPSFTNKVKLSAESAACLANLKQLASADSRTLSDIQSVLIYHFTEVLGHRPTMAKYIIRT